MRHNFLVRPIILQGRRRQYYETYWLAEITGPYMGMEQYAVIGHTVPGAVSKLANMVRKRSKGTLLDQPGRSSWNAGILGLNVHKVIGR
jgi:hypothetical protein